jgi:DNA-binding HxlR family transcriptional regulator
MDEAKSRANHWDTISFVIGSDYRLLVLNHLAAEPKVPSQIAADEQILIAHVSRAIRELRDRELIELRVPEDQQKHRLYGVTEQGEQVWQRMHAAGLT